MIPDAHLNRPGRMSGPALELSGTSFAIGDTVRRIGNPLETARVTYVSSSHDYSEMTYPDGFAFRTRKSEWAVVATTCDRCGRNMDGSWSHSNDGCKPYIGSEES